MTSKSHKASVLGADGHRSYSGLGVAERQEPESKALMTWGTEARAAADSDDVAGFITMQHEPQKGRKKNHYC